MKILAVSDTHGDRAILETILKQQPDLDGYFYAGDSELPADDSLFQTYHAVEGNMDFDPNFPHECDNDGERHHDFYDAWPSIWRELWVG